MKPAISRESAHNSQSQSDERTVVKTSPVRTCGPRASVAMFGLALSVGASGAILTSTAEAFAADSAALNNLPTKASGQPLGSVGSSHLSTVALAYHTVIEGETLWDIATYHGVDVAAIKQANALAEDAVIKSGQVLKIPANNFEVVASPSPQASSSLETLASDDERLKASEAKEETGVSGVAVATPASVSQGRSTGINDAAFEPEEVVSTVELGYLPSASTPLDHASAMLGADSVEISVSDDTLVAVERSSLQPLSVVESPLPTIRYEVQRGDTLWSIARDHQISPETLAEANSIRNPERIFVGRSLVIPAQATESVVHVAETPAPPSVELAASQNVALGISDQSSSLNTALVDSADVGVAPTEAPATAVDPYVANLLTEIREAQAVSESSEASQSSQDTSLEIASGSTTLDYRDDLEASLPLNPQFPSSPIDDANGIDEPISSSLLAAAPLGSEVYAPIVDDPTGRVVSPGMPILPDSSEYLPEAPSHFSGYVWPAHGVLTSGYGWRWGRMHRGIDVAGPVGTPIFAAAPGVVERSGWNSGGYGNLVDVRHPDGSMTRYAHNSRLLVDSGQQVRQGQQIAEMGSTGYSTGPHLHFEIHVPNQGAVNPISYLPGQ